MAVMNDSVKQARKFMLDLNSKASLSNDPRLTRVAEKAFTRYQRRIKKAKLGNDQEIQNYLSLAEDCANTADNLYAEAAYEFTHFVYALGQKSLERATDLMAQSPKFLGV